MHILIAIIAGIMACWFILGVIGAAAESGQHIKLIVALLVIFTSFAFGAVGALVASGIMLAWISSCLPAAEARKANKMLREYERQQLMQARIEAAKNLSEEDQRKLIQADVDKNANAVWAVVAIYVALVIFIALTVK